MLSWCLLWDQTAGKWASFRTLLPLSSLQTHWVQSGLRLTEPIRERAASCTHFGDARGFMRPKAGELSVGADNHALRTVFCSSFRLQWDLCLLRSVFSQVFKGSPLNGLTELYFLYGNEAA